MSMETTSMDSTWKGLYKVGGAALLIDGVLLFIAFALFAVGGNPPADTTQYLKTFATSNVNLATTGLFMVLTILFIPGILGLYGALKQANKAWMLTATALILLGIGVFFVEGIGTVASIQLANSYASASSASYIAAAQATIALTNAAEFFSGIIVSVGILLVGLTVLKGMMGKGLGYLSIAAGVLGLVGSVPQLSGLFFVFFLLYAVWFLWAGFKLWKMG